MKTILEIEITQPSTFPVVFNEETDSIPVGTEVHVYCQDAKSLWSGATWKVKIIGVREK